MFKDCRALNPLSRFSFLKLKKRPAEIFLALLFSLLLSLLLSSLVFFLAACSGEGAYTDEDELFDPVAFYKVNTVEINAVAAYGEIKAGTGLIIGGEKPIIVTSLHVSGTEGSLISVRFYGEEEFVNTNTIVNDNIIEVLSFNEAEDLCVFKVDYIPATLYNDLTSVIDGSEIVPLVPAFESLPGTEVYSLGNKHGQGIETIEGKITAPSQAVATQLGTMTLIQTSLSIADGCSGGAMFDKDGQLHGITSFSSTTDEHKSYATPAKFIYQIYNNLDQN